MCVCVRRLSTPKRRYESGSHTSAWGGRCVCVCVCVCEEAEHAKDVWERLPHVSLWREVCVCVEAEHTEEEVR